MRGLKGSCMESEFHHIMRSWPDSGFSIHDNWKVRLVRDHENDCYQDQECKGWIILRNLNLGRRKMNCYGDRESVNWNMILW